MKRVCRECYLYLELFNNFYKIRENIYRRVCKECYKNKIKKNREYWKEIDKKYSNSYYVKYKKNCKEYNKRYYEINKEKWKKYNKKVKYN